MSIKLTNPTTSKMSINIPLGKYPIYFDKKMKSKLDIYATSQFFLFKSTKWAFSAILFRRCNTDFSSFMRGDALVP